MNLLTRIKNINGLQTTISSDEKYENSTFLVLKCETALTWWSCQNDIEIRWVILFGIYVMEASC